MTEERKWVFEAIAGVNTGNPVRRPFHWSKCELMAAGPGCAGGDGKEVRFRSSIGGRA